MQFPLGHKLKILKRIKEVRVKKGMTAPVSRQDGKRPTSSSTCTSHVTVPSPKSSFKKKDAHSKM